MSDKVDPQADDEQKVEQPGDETPPADPPEKQEFSSEEMLQAIQFLAQHMDGLTKTQQAKFDELENRLQNMTQPAAKEPEEPTLPDDADLEGMSRKEFAQHLTTLFGKKLDKALGNLGKTVESVDERARKSEIEREIERTAGKHNDFYEWADEMRTIHKQNPTMSVEDAYTLARAKNPQKAARLDAALTKPTGKDPKKPEAGKEKGKEPGKAKDAPSYGGMAPGGSTTAPSSNMTFSSAAEDAWEKTMAKYDSASDELKGV